MWRVNANALSLFIHHYSCEYHYRPVTQAMQAEWARHEGECWDRSPGTCCYCLQCHLAAWPHDRRCANRNSAPTSSTQPRPCTFLGSWFWPVVGDPWLTAFPKKRSQKAHREPLPSAAPAARPLPQNAWWLLPPTASRGRSRSRSDSRHAPQPQQRQAPSATNPGQAHCPSPLACASHLPAGGFQSSASPQGPRAVCRSTTTTVGRCHSQYTHTLGPGDVRLPPPASEST